MLLHSHVIKTEILQIKHILVLLILRLDQPRNITAVTSTTITVNVGAVPIDEYISTTSSSEFAFGTGAYTIEFWVKPLSASLSGTKTLLDFRTQATEVAARVYLEAGQVRFNVNNVDVATSGLTTLNNNVWYHIAVVRSSTFWWLKLYIDGVERGLVLMLTTMLLNLSELVVIMQVQTNLLVMLMNCVFLIQIVIPQHLLHLQECSKVMQLQNSSFTLMELKVKYVDDWSGVESFTADEYFNNDAILATSRSTSGLGVTGFTGNSHRYINAADNIFSRIRTLLRMKQFIS